MKWLGWHEIYQDRVTVLVRSIPLLCSRFC